MNELSLSPMEVFEAIKLYSEHVDQRFTEILQEFSSFKKEVIQRFDRLEERIERLERKVGRLEERVEVLENTVHGLGEKMSTLVTKEQLNRLLLMLEIRSLLSSHDTDQVRQ